MARRTGTECRARHQFLTSSTIRASAWVTIGISRITFNEICARPGDGGHYRGRRDRHDILWRAVRAWFTHARHRFGILTGGATAIYLRLGRVGDHGGASKTPTHERDTSFTIIGTTALSTIAMVLYPIVAGVLSSSHTTAGGIFLGGTIHDVAQVVGAGYNVSKESNDMATIAKLLRVAMLLPPGDPDASMRRDAYCLTNANRHCCRGLRWSSPCWLVINRLGGNSEAGAQCRR